MKTFGRSTDHYSNEAKVRRKERKARMKRAKEDLKVKRKAERRINNPPLNVEAPNDTK